MISEPQPDDNAGQRYLCGIIPGCLVITGGQTPELLEFGEPVLDSMSGFV